MKSPFPGMDPYLEPHWQAVHTALVARCADMLNATLPDDLVARPEDRLAIDAPDWVEARGLRPDVRVFEPGTSESDIGGIALEAPYKLVVDAESLSDRFIKIIHPDDQRTITVLEFISPRNKRGDALASYLQKRRDLIDAGVHVVEIDLVREGNWQELLRPHSCPRNALATYRAVIRLAGDRFGAYLYPMPLSKPLPPIPIPLRVGDPRLFLNLQTLVEQVYEHGRYTRTIDYTRPLDEPLGPQDAAFADSVLKRPS